ncbi:MAG: TIR domain-containing protein [Balneolaceae bacterium]
MATDVNIYNIFIGHNWEHNEHIHKITEQLDRMNDIDRQFDYLNQADYKKPGYEKLSPEDLRIAYREQIENSDVVLLLTDMFEDAEEWMEYALDCAKDLDIPVLVIRSFNNKQVPARLAENADDVVFYFTEEVMKAIKSYV